MDCAESDWSDHRRSDRRTWGLILSDTAIQGAGEEGRFTLRALSSQLEYEAAVSLQESIWGADVREAVPACLLQVSQEMGGVSAGAFENDDHLLGFVFGLTGVRNGQISHWSHILAVHPEWRDQGVGKLLKQHQRQQLLGIGVRSMYWTYDPLESRNAHLNLNKLGAVVDRYAPHFYGELAVAETDTVIGTDRFIVRWDLEDPKPAAQLTAAEAAEIPCVYGGFDGAAGYSSDGAIEHAEPRVRVEVPDNIQRLKSDDPQSAAGWRDYTRRALTDHIGAGYRVAAFIPPQSGSRGFYILQRGRM